MEEAKQGYETMKAFLGLGISPEKHLTLIKVCQQVDNPDFVEAAINLSQIEFQTGMSYHR